MRVYATAQDLSGSIENPDSLLRQASLLVEEATIVDLYEVDADGIPSDPVIREAFREATVAQVEFWSAAKIDPTGGLLAQVPDVTSQSTDGSSVSYGGFRSAEAVAAAITSLCTTAMSILRLAGLTDGNAKPLLA